MTASKVSSLVWSTVTSAPRSAQSRVLSAPPAVAITRAPAATAELDRRRTDRAGAAADQHGLARLERGALVEREPADVERAA